MSSATTPTSRPAFSALEWTVALRYLQPRRTRGFLSIVSAFSLLGIFLGVGTLIIVMSVMNGFQEEIRDKILGVRAHVYVHEVADPGVDDATVIARLKTVPGVKDVWPTMERQVMATANGQAWGALVKAIDVNAALHHPLLPDAMVLGSLDDFGNGRTAIVGSRLAERLHLKIGDALRLISPGGETTAVGTFPLILSYTVVGLFQFGMHEYDSSMVFIPLETARKDFARVDHLPSFEIYLDNPETSTDVVKTLRAKLGSDYRVYDWKQANRSFFNALQVEKNVMFLILALIVLVSAFNIASSLIMLVDDKKKEIAILRTLGFTRPSVVRIFLICGLTLGMVGTILGVAGSLVFVHYIDQIQEFVQYITGARLFPAEIYFLSALPAKVNPSEVIVVAVLAMVVSFLATIFPSLRAARVQPAVALRYE